MDQELQTCAQRASGHLADSTYSIAAGKRHDRHYQKIRLL